VAWLLLVILAVLSFLATRAAAATSAPLVDRAVRDDARDADDDRDDDPMPDTVPRGASADPTLAMSPSAVANAAAIPEAPPIAAVVDASYAAASLDRDPSASWNARARLAGLVPQVTVADGVDSSWHDIDPNIGRRLVFEVRATWRLDRLLFDTNELHVATIGAARRREKRRIASLVIHAYFSWRRVVVAARLDGRWVSHVDEAVAELDALTDGWFSTELTARRHELSGRRTPGDAAASPAPNVGYP
jgi:hypothetical protein